MLVQQKDQDGTFDDTLFVLDMLSNDSATRFSDEIRRLRPVSYSLPHPHPSLNALSGKTTVASSSDAPHDALSVAGIDREQLRDYIVRLSFDVEFRDSLEAIDRIVAEDEEGFRKIFGG